MTAENNDNLLQDMMGFLVSKERESLDPAEHLEKLGSYIDRLSDAIENHPETLLAQQERMQISPEIKQLIGEVVISASWAEDAGGTYLQALSGDSSKRAKGYDDTSSSLVKALRKHAPKELVDRLEEALKLRHFVVHGIWINGSFVTNPETGERYDFVVMKRRYRSEAPMKDLKPVTSETLKQLAQEFWDIEEELEKLHSEVLFGKKEKG